MTKRQWAWLGLTGIVGSGAPVAAAEQALVDFSITAAPMTHRGSGFLHSIDGTGPSDDLIAAVKPQMFRDRPDGGNGGGIFAQYDRLKGLGVKHFQVVISDGFNGDYAGPYPGDDGTYLAWENYVTNLVLRAKQANVKLEYDIWNEPDIGYFWRRDEATFRETWKRAVNRIRLLDPEATIVGPSFATYGDGVKNFLLNAKADNVLPDVLAWHEFGSFFNARVTNARTFMAANGIDINRISLNEIVGTATFDGAPQWQSPGPLPRYFLNIERSDIESAAHACWGEPDGGDNCENASLNGLLTADTKQPRSTYWVYERYGQMSGTVAGFKQGVVRNDAGIATFDGLATKDDGVAHVLFGRTRSTDGSDVEVKLTNLDQVANLVRDGAVRVTGEVIADTKTAASSGPVITRDRIMRVADGQVVVPVPGFGNADAYFLKVQSVPTWARDGDGKWGDETAWAGGVPDGVGSAARLGPAGTAQRTVSVDSPRTVGLLTMDTSSGYRITGASTLTLNNGAARAVIEAVSGANEIHVKVQTIAGSAPDLVVSDGATLKVGGGNRLTIAAMDLGLAGTLDRACRWGSAGGRRVISTTTG